MSSAAKSSGHAALTFTQANFQHEVLESPTPVLVDFSAAWCGPCQQLAPIIEKLAQKYSGKAKIGKVDIDNDQDLAMQFDIMGVPTLLFFKGGELVERLTGARPEAELARMMDDLIR